MATTDFLKLSQDAFDASTSYIDANLRNDWDYSLRAFRNEHAAGSKYLSEEFKSRSRIFRPKTRGIIRKNEAAAMQAAFSNREIVSVDPGNPDDVMSVASAAAIKEVMEYRLDKTISTFEIYIGGVQDAQTTGTVCSYQYWEYEKSADGKKIKDQPCIELRPIENIRLDAGASWLDPVNSSPYFCDIIPMYVCDVMSMMENVDDKTGAPKWKKFDETIIAKAKPDSMDTTRKARLGNKEDPQDAESPIKSFDVVWVMRWFMRHNGKDMTYYTLGTEELLTKPEPIEKVYFHGKRPYVIGYAVLETHKALKTGLPMLTKPLQQESNEVANQRLDNVKFVLNKRWIVARGRQVDVQSLVRNVPGGVTLATDPKNDVQESSWPDVTSSAYVEQDRINSDFDELAGNFSPSTKVANNAVNDTLGGSKLAAAGAGLMTEYLLHTINVTWWEKVLRQLALLIQYYETDEIVLSVCANKAKLFPRFGISNITDMMLMNEVNVSVNMATGDPNQRLQKFLMATNAAIQLRTNPAPGANVSEMTKEIYCNAGYRDGARFFSDKQDPAMMKAMQVIQQLQGQLQGKQMEIQAGLQDTQMKLASNEKIKGAQLQIDQARIGGDLQLRQKDLEIQHLKLQIESAKIQSDLDNKPEGTHPAITEAEHNDLLASAELKRAQAQAAIAKAQADLTACQNECATAEMEAKTKQETELKKATLQASTQIEIAKMSSGKDDESTGNESRTDGVEVAKTAQIMEQILARQSDMLIAIAAPKTSRIVKGADGTHTVTTVQGM
jgi:hypothetical protein